MNPSGYTSLHGDYGQCTNSDGFISPNYVSSFVQKLRMFIPPGTRGIYLEISQYANCHGIVRMFQPPTNLILPAVDADIRMADWNTIQTQDMVVSPGKGKLTIFNTAIPAGVIPGWLYVYIFAGGSSSVWQNALGLYVDKAIYNPWQASVNWDRDIEGVTVYGTPVVQPAPAPTPQPVPVPTPAPVPAPTQFSFTCPCGRVYTTTK